METREYADNSMKYFDDLESVNSLTMDDFNDV